MNKRRDGQSRGITIPRSVLESIRAEAQQQADERLIKHTLPFIKKVGSLDRLITRFDQCVIDRGAGMMDQLNTIQKQIYREYCDIEKELRNVNLIDDNAKQLVDERLNAYHRLLAGDATAYKDLQNLTKQTLFAEGLVDLTAKVNRGGQPRGMHPPNQLIGQLGSQHKGKNAHETAVNVQKTLDNWLSANSEEHEDYGVYHQASALMAKAKHKYQGLGNYVNKQVNRYEKSIGE